MLAMMTPHDVRPRTTPNMNHVTTDPRATSKWPSKPAASLYAAECPYQEVTDSAMWAPWHSKLKLTKKDGYISHFCTTCVKELWREEVDDAYDDAYDDADAYDAYGGYGDYHSEPEY